ncbi:MAG: BlaI/MecI/CopY family transcriptional regulator [Candidatus Methanofastidiosa archaeon]|nr:BlaI/MecI/CopY family transcriptional regulator [Candidatus Methanofastidiosa archaeon]
MVKPLFDWHEYRPSEPGYMKVLGPLETDIMEILWKSGTETARSVYDILREDRQDIRRSTISIMMNRLFERGLIEKKIEKGRGGLKYIYSVKVTREQFESEIVNKVMDSLKETFDKEFRSYIDDNL